MRTRAGPDGGSGGSDQMFTVDGDERRGWVGSGRGGGGTAAFHLVSSILAIEADVVMLAVVRNGCRYSLYVYIRTVSIFKFLLFFKTPFMLLLLLLEHRRRQFLDSAERFSIRFL